MTVPVPPLSVRVAVFYGGVPIKQNIDVLNGDQKPHIIVGTPGRIKELVSGGGCF